MKQILGKTEFVSSKTLILIMGLILILLLSLHTPAVSGNEKDPSEIRIHSDGTMSVVVTDRPLKSVLQEIGNKTGIRILLYGVADEIISKKFKNLSLEHAIRNIIGLRSVSFLYQTNKPNTENDPKALKIVWVFDSFGSGPARDTIEPQEDAADDIGLEGREDDIVAHATLERPHIKLDYNLNSEEGFWVDRIVNATDLKEKEEAITELVEIDTDSAIAAISLAFDDKYPGLRIYAVNSLAKSQNPLSEQLIGQALHKDDDTQVAVAAAKVLVGRDSQVAVEFLWSAALSHKSRDVWKEVRKLLEPELADKIDKM